MRRLSSPLKPFPSARWRWLLPVALLIAVLHFSPLGLTLDRNFFDAASRNPLIPPPLPEDSALVLIDEQTMGAMSAQGMRWPFPRHVFAQLILALQRSEAAKIVVDFTFFEESDALEDTLLAHAAATAPAVVLARTQTRLPVFWPDDYVATNAAYFVRPRTGLVEFFADSDGIARRYTVTNSLAEAASRPESAQFGDLIRWHGGLETLRTHGVPVLSAAAFIEAGRPILERLVTAAPDLALDQFAAALADEAPLTGPLADTIRGRTVFVGANASGTYDLKPFPIGQVEPGVLIHWTAWANLNTTGLITALTRWSALLAAIVGAGLIVRAGRDRTSLTAPIVTAVLIAFVVLAGAYAALSAGWFFAPSTGVVACGLILLGVVVENFWSEQARKREIQAMFGAYVDPNVVDQLVRNPDAIRLGGEKREATVFFSDLAGFTDLSEKLPPEQMVEVVNAYLDETSECLHNHGAYVDKYIGDAVMAVFGVPQPQADHAYEACLSALEAQEAIARINARYAEKVGVKLKVRIGLNSGSMIAGNLGSARKKNYTVMGDAVNLASRLEGANKEFGTLILLGETTARAVAGRLATRPLTRLRVKGKLIAIEVHELIGRPETLSSDQRDFLAAYTSGYAHYGARRFSEAAADFSRALLITPSDAIARKLLQDSQSFAQTPPPADWEPILTLDTK
jgi:adenylate cyclase